jgi:glycosyltransferase involved in cell wall biosynthesis
MIEKHPYRATILPVPEGTPRPLWSVMIPTYNCANYLRETLASVLAQDIGPEIMQIEVIDDHSTKDDPEAVVRELAGDRVSFYRQPENVGYIKNFETCLQRSRGKLIHLLHGDDCVRDNFYHKMQQLFVNHPEIGGAFCRHIIMNDEGHWQRFSPVEQPESGVMSSWLERIAVKHSIQTPSIVVRREVYERLGGFDRRMLSCGEDWEMWVRIAAHYPMGYEVEPLALYRDRSNSLTKRSIRTGQNIRDVRKATEITKAYLPINQASKLNSKAREGWALWAFHLAEQMFVKGDRAASMIQMQEGLKCSLSWKIIKLAFPLILKLSKQSLEKTFPQKFLLKSDSKI